MEIEKKNSGGLPLNSGYAPESTIIQNLRYYLVIRSSKLLWLKNKLKLMIGNVRIQLYRYLT